MGNGQGLSIRNETDEPLLYVLSQLTPLHWGKVEPGKEAHVCCGKVWFTVSVGDWDERAMPTTRGVAWSVAGISASAMLLGVTAFGIIGTVSGIYSAMECKMNGVYADGRTLVVRHREQPRGFYYHSVEYCDDENNKVIRLVEGEQEKEQAEPLIQAPVVEAKLVIPDVNI